MKPIIWIEGNIGAGKTTLTKIIAEKLNLKPIFEPAGDGEVGEVNPLLEAFYADPKAFAFPMQIHLMMKRFNLQHLAHFEAQAGHYRGAVLDRGLPGDRVFCKANIEVGNIPEVLWPIYEQAFETMIYWLRAPALLIYLDVSPWTSMRRIKARARSSEDGIPFDYLKRLYCGYEDLMREIESKEHAWARGMAVARIPWDEDHMDPAPAIDAAANVLRY